MSSTSISINTSSLAGERLAGSLLAIRALFFLNGMFYATWATRIPAIQSQFSLSNGALGLALMVVALGAVVAMPSTGWLCQRFGSRRVIAVSLAMYLMGLPVIAMMPDITWLIGSLFVFGFGHGMLDVAMNVQAVEVERLMNRPINSSIHALWSVGGLTGAVLGCVIAALQWPVVWHFSLLAIVLAGASLPILTRLLPDPPQGQEKANAGDASAESKEPVKRSALLGVFLLGVIAFCVMAGEGAMADWSAVLLHQVLGASEGVAAMGYAVFAVAMASCRFAGDRVSSSLGPRRQVRFSALLALVGVVLAISSTHFVMALAGFALMGMGFATIVPAVFSACNRVPGVSPSTALASVSTIGYFGFLLGPPLIGLVAEWSSLRVALASIAVTMAATMYLARILQPKLSSDRSAVASDEVSQENEDLEAAELEVRCQKHRQPAIVGEVDVIPQASA